LTSLASTFTELGSLDRLAGQDTAVHRLDPRAKVVTTLVFLVAVVSFDRYVVAALLPFFLFPVVLAVLGRIPPAGVLKRLALASPFVLMLVALNPWLDRDIVMQVGPLPVSGGWLSLFSVLIRFCLTAGTVVLLIAVTGFGDLCLALERLKVPVVFVNQLFFLYRYLFVLADEGARLHRARSLRSFGGRGLGWRAGAQLIGHFLIRSLDRAQRIHLAMLSRGFSGEIKRLRPLRLHGRDVRFVIFWLAYFLVMRRYDVVHLAGRLVLEAGP